MRFRRRPPTPHAIERIAGPLTLALVGLGASAVLTASCAPAEPKSAFTYAAPAAPGTCVEWNGQPVDRTCIPRLAKADEPLVLEIEERCGACGSTVERCTVSVEGRVLTLSLDGKACEPANGAVCPEACAKNRVRCRVPPLPEARYEIRYGDTSGRVEVLDVAPVAHATTVCALEDGPTR